MPLVTVVIACHGDGKDLPVMLGCLANQREYHAGKCSRTGNEVLWCAGPPCKLPIHAIACWDGELPPPDRLAYGSFGFDIVECPKEGGVGHHTRQPGIEAVAGEWTVLTNMDNYFVQGWRHRIEGMLRPDHGIVYWNVLNNLWRWSNYNGTQLKRGHADLSCCAVRTEIARAVGFPWRNYDGDWDYIEACVKEARKRRLKVVHIPETLSVHN